MILDITLPIRPGMVVWPGDPAVELEGVPEIAEEGFYVSRLCMGTHTGTHVDPPRHISRSGAGADALPLEVLVGPCYVADLRGVKAVDAASLQSAGIPPGTSRLLLKTDNSSWIGSSDAFREDFVALTPDAAEWVLSRGIRLVGIDTLSIEAANGDGSVHRVLLDTGVIIIEGLALDSVEPGNYNLACLPLKIAGSDGAPARVVLMTE